VQAGACVLRSQFPSPSLACRCGQTVVSTFQCVARDVEQVPQSDVSLAVRVASCITRTVQLRNPSPCYDNEVNHNEVPGATSRNHPSLQTKGFGHF
jgi:hypothetical protein